MVEASLVSGESLLVVGDVVSEGSGGRKTKVDDDNGDENGKERE